MGFPGSIEHAVHEYGYAAVGLGLLFEHFGLPLPGETMLIGAAVLASKGELGIKLLLVSAWAGATLGNLAGYAIGRSGGHFATCLAAEIHPDGTMRIANAGHLPPYLNGREMEVEGSLPLGVTEKAEYPVQTFRVKPGDRLTFMTDGVVEATNEAKELFGFERTREISIQSAVAIVDEAQRFGQEDDITVLAVAFAV